MQKIEESQNIVNRFFACLDRLKEENYIRGFQTFTRKYNINKRNFYTIRKNPSSGMFEVGWLQYLVLDYGVSPTWLLTGRGVMFNEK